MTPIRFGIIGGSGLYKMDGLEGMQEVVVDTPYGAPSDAIATGTLDGVPVAFLARHGRSHSTLPGDIPFRANIWALKSLGVDYLVSVSAVGSLKEALAPRHMALPDQFIDLTRHRPGTFFGDGAVAHVSLAHPVCTALSAALAQAFDDCALPDAVLHRGGTYVCIEGPQFSSLAESNLYRAWGGGVIGMTNMPEAKLAREAQIAYTTLALVTDFDCWHPQQAQVSADLALANLLKNAGRAQRVAAEYIALLGAEQPASEAHTALKYALVTQPDAMAPEVRARLAALLG